MLEQEQLYPGTRVLIEAPVTRILKDDPRVEIRTPCGHYAFIDRSDIKSVVKRAFPPVRVGQIWMTEFSNRVEIKAKDGHNCWVKFANAARYNVWTEAYIQAACKLIEDVDND